MTDYIGHPLGLVGWFARTIQAISSIIVLGITAWAVQENNKTLSVIFSLVIATTSLVVLAVAVGISCLGRRAKWHIIPLLVTDAVISYLWLTSFILLALNFNRRTCRVNRWIGEVSCSRSYTAEAFSFIAFYEALLCNLHTAPIQIVLLIQVGCTNCIDAELPVIFISEFLTSVPCKNIIRMNFNELCIPQVDREQHSAGVGDLNGWYKPANSLT
ncbi:uncharacterized protein An02g00510 [Aspergillus niger]|uniref:Contig An02c0010, genomic contig n=2 Tax=Aspergillus niger TaxID=5061 RepID=A2QBL9_ASPNC|nr:uncharacterized protein An02g00510 [Aspergillus niger]CAK96266.1 unnamed protein product [Aspergillus niger]